MFGEHINDFFNFTGNDISACEIPIPENGGEDTFSEEVLNEHLLYSSGREIRINRGLTLLMETGKRFLKVWVVLAFRFDESCQLFTEFRHLVFEFRDGGMPCRDVLFLICEKALKHTNEVFGFGDVQVQLQFSVLVEEGMRWGLDNDIF